MPTNQDPSSSEQTRPDPYAGSYVITRPDQLRAIATPARREVLDVFVRHGPASAAEAAEFAGVPRSAVYYHLRELRRVGLVLEHHTEADGRQRIVHYTAVAKKFRFKLDKEDPDQIDLIAAVVASDYKEAAKAYREQLVDPASIQVGPLRDLMASGARCWLDEAALAEVNGYLDKAFEIMVQGGTPGPGKKRMVLTAALHRARQQITDDE